MNNGQEAWSYKQSKVCGDSVLGGLVSLDFSTFLVNFVV